VRRRALLVLLPVLLVAACGTGSGTKAASPPLPSVSGSYGDKPTLTFPSDPPSKTLQKKVLHAGTGTAVAKGDLLVADYLGQVWKGKVFDNSYDRKQPIAIQIGAAQVIPGWDNSLVGVKAGSRVLLSIPPADGYGSQGNSNAGIKGTDTIVFVVDVVSSFGKSAVGDPKATPQPRPAGGAQVTGALGAEPKVTIPAGTAAPTTASTTVLAKGSGAPVKAGLLVAQFEAVDWTGKLVGSTWQKGAPGGLYLGDPSQPSVLDPIVGVPLGSRVLLQLPAQQAQAAGQAATPAEAVALDLVAQPGPAKSAR
jgi:peptidylprolyl isomerase